MADATIQTRPDIVNKPIDEMGSLDDQFDDLLHAAEHASQRRQRFALCVDATASMRGVWSRAQTALKQAVDEIKSRSNVPVQMCIIGYRDHIADPAEHVLTVSEWSDDTNYLKSFIESTRCFGGGDYPESIGHALKHILSEQEKTSQVILIGDAPSKGGSLGYAEAKQMGRMGCPIYALYTTLEDSLVECFEKLARLSNGRAFPLERDTDMSDLFKVLLAQNKALEITYQPTSIEGKRLAESLA